MAEQECVAHWPTLLGIVKEAAFALWALVVLIAVKELRGIRKVLKNGNGH